jgi:CRISPR/Cas system CSM-associated protein Csm3 (group 7 of RAMP superfamily)
MEYSSGAYINKHKEEIQKEAKKEDIEYTAIIYRRSDFVSQMFGHTSLAARIRFADAYPTTPLKIEERNGVAIDRIYGSVAQGPFNYETVVEGVFTTRITMKNFTLAQLGLLGLALRDLGAGRIGIGFGKSRGLGRVTVTLDKFTLTYPTCKWEGDKIQLLHGQTIATTKQFVGIGAFVAGNKDYDSYHFPEQDTADLPAGLSYQADDLMGISVVVGNDQITDVWKACMPAWRAKVEEKG